MVCDWSLAALLQSSDRLGVQRAVQAMCLKMLNLFLVDSSQYGEKSNVDNRTG